MNLTSRKPLVFMLLSAAGLAAIASCSDDTSAPPIPRAGFLAIAPSFNSNAASIVDVAIVAILLERTADGSIVLDTAVALELGADSVDISLTVPVLSSDDTFLLTLSLIDTAGDTVFRGEPQTVTPSLTGGADAPAVLVPLVYTGVGSNAAAVAILTANPTVFFGDSVELTAVALDSVGQVIANTPIAFTSLDPVKATVPDRAVGIVVSGLQRGQVSIEAKLLTDQADTVAVTVQPVPSALQPASGDLQTGTVGAALTDSLAVRVIAADSLGVAGVVVVFSSVDITASLSADTVTTDAQGLAAVSWTLGTVAGAQQVIAAVSGIADTVSFTATAQVGVASIITIVSGDGQSGIVGTTLVDSLIVLATDINANAVAGATVTWTVVAGSGTPSADTTFTDSLGLTGIVFTLGTSPATNSIRARLAAADSVDFAATQDFGSPAQLAFSVEPASTTAGSPFTAEVLLRDASANTITTDNTTSVDLGILAGTGKVGASLSGTTPVVVVGGVASFSGFSIDSVGTLYQLEATATGLTAATSASFDVNIGAPASVLTTPTADTLFSLSDTTRLSATVRDPGGNLITSATVTWASLDNAIATVDATGLVTAVANGTVSITATSGTPADTAQVVVSQVSAQLVFTVQPSNTTAGFTMPAAVEVEIRDSLGSTATTATDNVTLSILTSPSGDTLGGTATVAASAGVATFSGISFDSVGSGYSLTATASGITSDTSAPFIITPVGMTKLWTGADASLPTDVSQSLNWSPTGVPGAADNVFVPASAINQPVLSATTSFINDLYIENGASLTISSGFDLEASGNVVAGNTITGSGTLTLTGAGATLRGTVPNLELTGAITATDSVIVNGSIRIAGSAATLVVSGQRILITGNLVTGDATAVGTLGTLTMTDPADSVLVLGDATFAGSSTQTKLTAGVLSVQGNFVQNGLNDSLSFAASGTHKTVLAGTAVSGTQSVSFTDASDTQTQFQDLEIATVDSLHMSTAVNVTGSLNITSSTSRVGSADTLRVFGSGGVTIASGGRVSAKGLQVAGPLTGAGIVVDKVIFSGPSQTIPSGITYNNVGVRGRGTTAAHASLNGATTITGTLRIGGASGTDLTVNGQKLTVGTLTVGQSASATGNLVMQNANDSVIVTGNATFLGASTSGLLTNGVMTVAGNFGQAGVSAQSFLASGNHKVLFNGTVAQTISFNTPATSNSRFQDLTITNAAGVSFNSTAFVGGNLVVSGSGSLDMNSSTVTVTGGFSTQNTAVLKMVSASDVLTVQGNILFAGGNTGEGSALCPAAGCITDGTINASGNFTQDGTNSLQSFHARLFNEVRFVGTAAQSLSFANPADGAFSHFANVRFDNVVGVTLVTNIYAHCDLISLVGSTALIIGNGNTFTVGGLNVNDLKLDRVLLVYDGDPDAHSTGAFVLFTNVAFTNYNVIDDQFTIVDVGTAANPDFTLSGLTFDTQPTLGVGHYAKAEDSDGTTPNVLEVQLGFFLIPSEIPDCNASRFLPVNGAQIFFTCS